MVWYHHKAVRIGLPALATVMAPIGFFLGGANLFSHPYIAAADIILAIVMALLAALGAATFNASYLLAEADSAPGESETDGGIG